MCSRPQTTNPTAAGRRGGEATSVPLALKGNTRRRSDVPDVYTTPVVGTISPLFVGAGVGEAQPVAGPAGPVGGAGGGHQRVRIPEYDLVVRTGRGGGQGHRRRSRPCHRRPAADGSEHPYPAVRGRLQRRNRR